MLKLKMNVQSIYDKVITDAVNAAQDVQNDQLIDAMNPHLGVNIQAYKQSEGKVYFVSRTIPGIKLASAEFIDELEDEVDNLE